MFLCTFDLFNKHFLISDMVSKNLTYINGHFYDKESGKRIALKEGIDISITADDKNFIPAKPAGNKPKHILISADKLIEIEEDKKVKQFKKVFDAGKVLYFHIPKRMLGSKLKYWRTCIFS